MASPFATQSLLQSATSPKRRSSWLGVAANPTPRARKKQPAAKRKLQPHVQAERASSKEEKDKQDFSKWFGERLAEFAEALAKERETIFQKDLGQLHAEIESLRAQLREAQDEAIAATAAATKAAAVSAGKENEALLRGMNEDKLPPIVDGSESNSFGDETPLTQGIQQNEGKIAIKDLMRVAIGKQQEEKEARANHDDMDQNDGLMKQRVMRKTEISLSPAAERRRKQEKMLYYIEVATLMMSILSAIVVGLEADNEDWGKGLWLGINTVMLGVFWLDVVAKLWVLGLKGYFWGEDKLWNCFDFVITVLSTIDWFNDVLQELNFTSFSLTTLRILRIVRLAKFVKGEVFKDLNALIYGFIYGLSSLFWAIFLMMVVSYGLGCMMRLTVGNEDNFETGEKHFGTIPKAMFTVFRCLNSDCSNDQGQPLVLKVGQKYDWQYKFLYSVILLIFTLGLLNVVLALFVERVLEGAKYSHSMRERMERKDASYLSYMKKQLVWIDDFAEDFYRKHPEELTDNEKLTISERCFIELIREPRFVNILDEMGVNMEDMDVGDSDLFMIISPDGQPIPFESLFNEFSYMRGEARVTFQVLTLLLQNRTLKLLQKLAGKFNITVGEEHHVSAPLLSRGRKIAFEGLSRRVEIVVGEPPSNLKE